MTKDNQRPGDSKLCRKLQDFYGVSIPFHFLWESNKRGRETNFSKRDRGDAIKAAKNFSIEQAGAISNPRFIVPEKSAGFRPVTNLKKLNKFVEFNFF